MSRASLSPIEVRHGRSGRDMLRAADPLLHVRRRVREMAADDHPERDAVEWRADHPRSVADVMQCVAAATAVLNEHGLAAIRVTLGNRRRVATKARTLLCIFDGDPYQRDHEKQRSVPATVR